MFHISFSSFVVENDTIFGFTLFICIVDDPVLDDMPKMNISSLPYVYSSATTTTTTFALR